MVVKAPWFLFLCVRSGNTRECLSLWEPVRDLVPLPNQCLKNRISGMSHQFDMSLLIFLEYSGKQRWGDKIHGFLSEPFLLSNIMFFPQKWKAHLVILINYKIWSLLYEAKYVATVICRKCVHHDLSLPSWQSLDEPVTGSLVSPDADAEIEGAPAAPLDVVSLDANKDYIIISWKQPAVDGGSPILGYFIDKLVLGLTSIRVLLWMYRCVLDFSHYF